MNTRYWIEEKADKKGKPYWAAFKESPLPEPNPHGLCFKARLVGAGFYKTKDAANEAIERESGYTWAEQVR